MDTYYRVLARLTVAMGSLRREEGHTFTEYAIIVATIAVGTVLAVDFLRTAVTKALTDAANAI